MTKCFTKEIHTLGIDENILIQLSKEYQLDVGFVYATWALETGYGTSTAWLEHNNPAGIIRTDGVAGYRSYASQYEGLRDMFDLIQHYCSSGNCTVARIRDIWSEAEDTHKIITIWQNALEEQ